MHGFLSSILVLAIFCFSGCSAYKQPYHAGTEAQAAASSPIPLEQENDSDAAYAEAFLLIQERKYPQAVATLSSWKEDKAVRLCDQLRYLINGSYIFVGGAAVAAIDARDKKAVTIIPDKSGSNSPNVVYRWSELPAMRAVFISFENSLNGLSEEGELLNTSAITAEQLRNSGNVPMIEDADVVEEILTWSLIKELQIDWPESAAALFDDGTVRAAHRRGDTMLLGPIEGWSDIVSVVDGGAYVVGLKRDGTLLSWNCPYEKELSEWSNIVSLDCGYGIVGLMGDGTVKFAGENFAGIGDVGEWRDIIAISTTTFTTLGLKRDGTVIAAGENRYGQLDVSDWVDIVAIDCSDYLSIGLKADGTMVLAGDSITGGMPAPDVSLLKNLFVPAIHIEP